MPNDITAHLPSVIVDHIDACNNHDIDAWMATFTQDALVNDVQREFAGGRSDPGFCRKGNFGASLPMAV